MTVVMLGLFIVLVTIASGYPAGARFMPFVVGIPAIILGILQLFIDARERNTKKEVDTRTEAEKAEAAVTAVVGKRVDFHISHDFMAQMGGEEVPEDVLRRREIAMWAYFLGFILSLILFGFWISIPIFLITFIRFQAEKSWLFAISLSLSVSVVLYIIFEKIFRVVLHTGFVTDYLVATFGG
jgi:hypothetical protein